MMNKASSIFVAGHRGMVGSAIVRTLKDKGYSNLILATRDELDLFTMSAVQNFFEKTRPEYVILAAARVGGIKANMTYPADFLYENLVIQNNVIWAALKHDVKKLLFLGSSCIYPRRCQQPMKEEYFLSGPPEPTNSGYAIAKIAGLELCRHIHSQYKKDFISCMPTNIYGPQDNFKDESSHVIPSLIRRMHTAKMTHGKNVIIWGSGKSRREFLFVDDLAEATMFLMKHYDDSQFLNIGTGMDISIKELATLIQNVVGYTGTLIFDSSKPDGMPKKLLDVEKINTLGWRHQTALEDGLKKTYKWYLQHIDEYDK